MRIDAKILQMRITRLKQLIADTCIPTDAPEEIRHVLNTEPQYVIIWFGPKEKLE